MARTICPRWRSRLPSWPWGHHWWSRTRSPSGCLATPRCHSHTSMIARTGLPRRQQIQTSLSGPSRWGSAHILVTVVLATSSCDLDPLRSVQHIHRRPLGIPVEFGSKAIEIQVLLSHGQSTLPRGGVRFPQHAFSRHIGRLARISRLRVLGRVPNTHRSARSVGCRAAAVAPGDVGADSSWEAGPCPAEAFDLLRVRLRAALRGLTSTHPMLEDAVVLPFPGSGPCWPAIWKRPSEVTQP